MVHTFIEWLVRKVLSRLLFIFWLALTSPPLWLLVWLRESHEKYAATVSWLGVPLVLAWILGSIWLTLRTDYYLFEQKYLFLTALKFTLSDLWCQLAFFSLVGYFFTPDKNNTRDDEDGP